MKKTLLSIVAAATMMAQTANVTATFNYEDIKLTARDLVDMIAEYDIQHQDIPQMEGFAYGLTDMRNKVMYLNKKQDVSDLRDTILHEAYHVKLKKLGINLPEKGIEFLADQSAKELYHLAPVKEEPKPQANRSP